MNKLVRKFALTAALTTFTIGGINMAQAQDPLKYPPFSWPSEKAEKPAPPERKVAPKPGKPDIYQNRDASKQWYDGDFLGMDDD
jgi:hypothetical protein